MIKLVVFDFDGVFTNGTITFDNNKIVKSYNVKDGTGIGLLRKNNIEIGVISGYVENDSQKAILDHLKIKHVSLNNKNKIETLNQWCQDLKIDLKEEVAYMGDDINDLCVLKEVKLPGCPSDAHHEVIETCNILSGFISTKKGGKGCVRDFCDFILNQNSEQKQPSTLFLEEIKREFFYQANNFNLSTIENLADLIQNTNGNIYFCGVGKSGNIAKHCCDLLKCISLPSFYFDLLNSTHGDIGTLTANDIILLFSNSGNTKEIVDLIPSIKEKGTKTIGVCCNEESKFKKLCDKIVITPFQAEISGEINKIPTNSFMSHLIFSNILVSLLKNRLSLTQYSENHPAGNIGSNLKKIKDVLITDFPKVYMKDSNRFEINDILLEMTRYKIGSCMFIDYDGKLFGIITDGDLRRLLLRQKNLQHINIEDINTTFRFESDLNKFLSEVTKKNTFIPVIIKNELVGIFRV